MNASIAEYTLRIGRHYENDFLLSDPSVSRYHAELTQHSDGRYLLVDCQSTQGTRLLDRSGKLLPITQEWVKPEDRVQFGRVTVQIREILGNAQPQPTPVKANPKARKIRCGCGAVKVQGGRCHVCGHA